MNDIEPAPAKKTRGRPPKNQALVASEKHEATTSEVLSDAAAIIRAITLASRDPELNIANMQYLLDTRRTLLMEEAEQAYNDAMARVQALMEPIAKQAENPQTHSKYASYPALDAALRPIYSSEGFALQFDTAPAPNPADILIVLDVTHGRFKKRYSIPMPCDGKGPRGNDVMSRTHAVGSAVTYGRRYLLCCAFNIVTGDDDGNRAGVRASSSRAPLRGPGEDGGGTVMVGPPPSDIQQRARHTRQAIEAATTHARAGLMQQLEGSVEASDKAELLKELRQLMQKAKVAAGVVCEVFSVEDLDDLTVDQVQTALKKVRKNLG